MRPPRFLAVFAFVLLLHGAPAETVTVSLLATTDLHGQIYPIDYFTDRPAPRGLAKIATLVRQERARNPNSLLIDCGDTIQGSPLEYVWQHYVRNGRLPLELTFPGPPLRVDPMILLMNEMGYDAMVLGNHEFNYGLKNLGRAREDARFPWISANTSGGGKPFLPYVVKSVAGVTIAVIGVTTPAVPSWEQPRNIERHQFGSMKDAVRKAVDVLRREQHPDVIVVAAHAGLDRDLNDISGVPGVDAIVFGHTHQQLAEGRAGDVLLVQPKNWGMSLARIDFVLEKRGIVRKSSRLIPVGADTPADKGLLALARPYHDLAQRYLNTGVAESDQRLEGTLGRVRDTALVDAIHAVQLHYAKADVSFTSLFDPGVRVPKGRVTVRQLAALYLYDNELYAIEGTGRMVKEALENAARYFLSCQGQACTHAPLINSRVIGFNYDMAQGVKYEIDLTRPEGDRIRNLKWKGRPLDPDQHLRIAVNNYRAAGSAGYAMFRGVKILWRSSGDIRDLMIQYYTERGRLPASADGNWRIVPPEALRTLERQARAEGGRAPAM